MISTQKTPTLPGQSQKANSGSMSQAQPAAPPAHLDGPDHEFCVIHHLEEALQLTTALHLTSDQATKIADLTKQQAGRCAAAHQAHRASHDQILAILTPVQQATLKAMSPAGPEHCASGGPAANQESRPAAC